MKFGVALVPDDFKELAIRAKLAEDLGFDYIGVPDSQSLWPELYVSLSVIANATSRVHLGPTVTNPLTRHPAVAASAIASINQLSEGRAFLGIGSGDSAILNLGLRPAKLAELHEYLQALRTLLTGQPFDYKGKSIHVKWANSPVPLIMSAEGPKTLALAGGIADAVIVHSGLTKDVLADTIRLIRDGERAAGRPEGSAKVWAFAKCNIADRHDDAIDEIKMALAASGHHAFRFTLEGKHVPEELQEAVKVLQGEYEPSEHEQLGETRNAALSDELGLTDFLADRFAVAGTPDECLEKVRIIRDAGVDNLLILAISSQTNDLIRRFGEQVIARL
ncbi:MAG: LLM class flavin-dependent oxidoreductase [SAR202 cluster bacterium]|nr:LLM class flavin-dependent oxidoreductase [SAR202 cluster bacterium]